MTERPRLSIGEFAGKSGLSAKALRLYDEPGPLPPDRVGPHTGYRLYNHLPPTAAAVEVGSYWRQVEADAAARREIAALLVDHLSGEDGTMTGIANWALRSASALDGGLVPRARSTHWAPWTRGCRRDPVALLARRRGPGVVSSGACRRFPRLLVTARPDARRARPACAGSTRG
ncbi:MerR family DNA-binding transcriptional regulator [Saccharomonospora sp. NPDC006951]